MLNIYSGTDYESDNSTGYIGLQVWNIENVINLKVYFDNDLRHWMNDQ